MSSVYSKVYELPYGQLSAARRIFEGEGIRYVWRFGFFGCLLEVLSSERAEIGRAEDLLTQLWVTREETVFRSKHRELVREELATWGIPYEELKNPFAFEIRTEIDQRILDRFVAHIGTLTRKDRRGRGRGRKDRMGAMSVPRDVSSLLD